MKEMFLSHQAKSGDLHMSFVTLKKGVCEEQKCAEKLGAKWRDLLKTDGLAVSLYPLSETELLYTEDGGRVIEARDYLLTQPEVEKFRWKDTDFFPPSSDSSKVSSKPATGPAAAGADKRKKSKKKGKKGAKAEL